MKERIASILLAAAFVAAAFASPTVQPAAGDKPAAQEQVLTDQQKATVRAILSKYSPSSLTVDDARAIHEAFRAAGLRAGPAMADVMREAGFDPEVLRKLAPPPGRNGEGDEGRAMKAEGGSEKPGGGQRGGDEGGSVDRAKAEGKTGGPRTEGGPGGYSLEQAVSDRAQLTTIAFDGLAFMTGSFECNTFLPPGKVSDFFGFQYMRDIDKGELGHNTSFLTRIANSVLAILNENQKQQLVALAKEQAPQIAALAYKRFPLVKAFCRLRDRDLPLGATGLDEPAVEQYSAEVYALSGGLAYRRAQVIGSIIRSFDPAQKTAFAKLSFGDSRTWPDKPDQVDKRSLSHEQHVAAMTYASELFSWYAGSAEADAYFCPEGHGTYFGAFYMKDKPAMGNPDYSISTTITGNSGEQFLAVLTETQRRLITGLVDAQRSDLAGIVTTRRAIAQQLRRFLTTASVDESQVLALCRRYGELDGELSSRYATAFVAVYQSLTGEQKAALARLRGDVSGTCEGAYLYSQPIAMPDVPSTDFLFNHR
jgi:hypothetical protein